MKKLACVVTALLVLGGVEARAQFPPTAGPGEQQFRGPMGPGNAWAQNPPPPGRGEMQPRPEGPGAGPGMGRAMEEAFFAPELVMRNQGAIGLRPDQQEAIRAEMQKTMARFTDLQWQQSAQVEVLEALYRKQAVDEKEALAQFDKLLALESEIKRLRLASLIRVKNLLTPEQQAQLRELGRPNGPRFEDPQRRMGGAPSPGGMPPAGMPVR